MTNNEIYFSILEHIGVLAEYQTAWKKEINIISWNGGSPKFDIRDWSPDHEHMSRGITLHSEEALMLMEHLQKRFAQA